MDHGHGRVDDSILGSSRTRSCSESAMHIALRNNPFNTQGLLDSSAANTQPSLGPPNDANKRPLMDKSMQKSR